MSSILSKRDYKWSGGDYDMTHLDLARHDNLIFEVIGVNAACIALICLVAGSRAIVRFKVVRSFGFGLDDVLISFASITGIALSVLCFVGVRYGLGKHLWDIAPFTQPTVIVDQAQHLVQVLIIAWVFYAASTTLAKCSIIASYLRIFPHPRFRLVMIIMWIIIVTMGFICILVTIFSCIPVYATWTFSTSARCINISDFFYASAVFNVLTDLLLCILPMPLVWRLKLPRVQKLVICLLFFLGIGASGACIVRLSLLHQLEGLDFSFTTVKTLHFTVIEPALGIVCGSAPALRPLVSQLISKVAKTTSHWRTMNKKISSAKEDGCQQHDVSTSVDDNTYSRPPDYYEDFITAPYNNDNENGYRLSSIRRPSEQISLGGK